MLHIHKLTEGYAMRPPRYHHSTKVNSAYLARIEAEHDAAITPEDRARQNADAERFAAVTAAGFKCATCAKTCDFSGHDMNACANYISQANGN